MLTRVVNHSRKDPQMTAQAHEILIYEGEQTSMAFCPEFPTDHPEIVESSDEDGDGFIMSTACWRGYIGTWEIKDDHFFLKSLRGRYKVRAEEGIHALWFTGVLRVPQGELLQYVHMGFGSVYEKEIHVKIEDGIVVKTREVDNRNREIDGATLGWENLPGGENSFDGDDF